MTLIFKNYRTRGQEGFDNIVLACLPDKIWKQLDLYTFKGVNLERFYSKCCFFSPTHHGELTIQSFRYIFTHCLHCDNQCVWGERHWYSHSVGEFNEPFSREKYICCTFGILRKFLAENQLCDDLLEKLENESFQNAVFEEIFQQQIVHSVQFTSPTHSTRRLMWESFKSCFSRRNPQNCRILVADFLNKDIPNTTYHTLLLYIYQNLDATFRLSLVPEVIRDDDLSYFESQLKQEIHIHHINMVIVSPLDYLSIPVNRKREEMISNYFKQSIFPLVTVYLDEIPEVEAKANKISSISFKVRLMNRQFDLENLLQNLWVIYGFVKDNDISTEESLEQARTLRFIDQPNY